MTSKTDRMREIRDEVMNLQSSPLYSYRTTNKYYPVIGEGGHDAHIMFIGEAPGEKEALSGRPFCGASGKFLDTLMQSIGLVRADAYVTNIVKDRPPDNRDPTAAEIALYAPFLVRQIEIIQPKVIATLGRFSMTYLLELFNSPRKTESISALHGKLVEISDEKMGSLKLLPLYHPAVALYNPNMRTVLLEDFKAVKKLL